MLSLWKAAALKSASCGLQITAIWDQGSEERTRYGLFKDVETALRDIVEEAASDGVAEADPRTREAWIGDDLVFFMGRQDTQVTWNLDKLERAVGKKYTERRAMM